MSYGGQSNPPWQRNTMANAGQSQMQQTIANAMNTGAMQSPNTSMHYQNQQMYGQNMSQAQQNQNVGSYGMNQMQSNPVPLFPPAVSYPTASRGNMNAGGFPGNPSQAVTPSSSANNYNAFGTVTKVLNDCGFVDDEVFFHKNVCKGPIPKVGERVLVEASFNQNSTFKWNATRIQIVSSGSNSGSNSGPRSLQPPPLMGSGGSNMKGGSGYNAVPPPNEYAGQFGRSSRRKSSPSRRSSPDRRSRKESRHIKDEDESNSGAQYFERKRRREERERERRERDKLESIEKRERSPKWQSPKRRRTRAIPRYMVQIPKIALNLKKADVLELRRRYTNLYVPSDFFFTQIKWLQAFPPNNPFSIQRPCSFHIMHKLAQPPKDTEFAIDPPDADYLFVAKVMLMGVPPIAEIYQKCLDDKECDDERDFIHPTRLINFLIGVRGKNETMAIGGPWSPSLDGENPQSDPTVLIKTAIRTCKFLTGVDLAGCTQWYRFVELYYRRPETVHKGHLIPARVETVVIFLPDVNSCMPTRTEWERLQGSYKTTLEDILNQSEEISSDWVAENAVLPPSTSTEIPDEAEKNGQPTAELDVEDTKDNSSTVTDETGNEKDEGTRKCEPTPYSELEPKSMKLQELRDELTARNLSSKGLKPQLIARLSKVLKTEKLQAESKDNEEDIEMEKSEEAIEQENSEENEPYEDHTEMDMSDIVVLDEYDSTKLDEVKPSQDPKKMDERDRQQLERRYKLPENPNIIVHPSKTAKGGKFDCAVQSLSLLLDYRPEDTKEHSFEVALFAELFNEMLMRDFGFNIYKEVVMLPEKPKEKDDPSKKKDEGAEENPSVVESEKESTEKSTKEPEIKRETNNTVEKNKVQRNIDSEKNEKKSSVKDKKPAKRPHEDDSEEDNNSLKSGDRKRRPKPVIVNPELLLSFVYFDTTHCGYMFEKDIEELFHIIGLNLSRAQVRKLLGKIITRDALYYRKLSEKPKDEEATAESKNGKEESAPKQSIDLNQLAKGNKSLLPVFKNYSNTEILPAVKDSAVAADVDNSSSGMISYNGGMIDVGKLVEQMKRSERAREETEQILSNLQKQNTELISSQTKSNAKIKDLLSDVKSLSRKLTDSEQSFSTINRKTNDYFNTLANIYDRLSPMFGKRLTERSSRSDSGRDKEKDTEREKDKERDRDREKEDKDRDKEKEKKKDKEEMKDVKDDKDRKDRDKEKDKEETKDIKDEKERKERDKEEKDKEETKDVKDREKGKEKDKEETRDVKDDKDRKDQNKEKDKEEDRNNEKQKDTEDIKISKEIKNSNDGKNSKEDIKSTKETKDVKCARNTKGKKDTKIATDPKIKIKVEKPDSP